MLLPLFRLVPDLSLINHRWRYRELSGASSSRDLKICLPDTEESISAAASWCGCPSVESPQFQILCLLQWKPYLLSERFTFLNKAWDSLNVQVGEEVVHPISPFGQISQFWPIINLLWCTWMRSCLSSKYVVKIFWQARKENNKLSVHGIIWSQWEMCVFLTTKLLQWVERQWVKSRPLIGFHHFC